MRLAHHVSFLVLLIVIGMMAFALLFGFMYHPPADYKEDDITKDKD